MTVDPTAETAAEPAREGRPLVAGEMLGKYRLDRVLGEGGMGIVWAAFDPDLERAVAIKVLRAGESDATLRARLLREARAMARLKHPNVLTVYEVGTVHNRDYISMELVDGDSLDAWLATRPPREQLADALLAAGRGLAAAHAAGLVHRDFKPHNVLRSREGHVYVTDFGLARGQIEDGVEVEQRPVAALADELARGSQFPRRGGDSVLDSPLTQTGVLIGTPAYMAPEQFAGRAPDARTDQFAFCVTAWEALTGARPFRGNTLPELEAAAAGGVRTSAGELPPRLRAVLARGLDPSPNARWPDLPALLGALSEALSAQPVAPAARQVPAETAGAPPTAPRTARRVLLLGAAAGVTTIAVLFAVRSSKGDECGPAEEAFEGAWSPERHSAVAAVHPYADMVGAGALFEGARASWLESYRAVCAEPPGPERSAHLDCLQRSRDAIAAAASALATRGSSVDVGKLGTLAAMVAMCSVPGAIEHALPPRHTPRPPRPPPPVARPPAAPQVPEAPDDDTDTDTDKDPDEAAEPHTESETEPGAAPDEPREVREALEQARKLREQGIDEARRAREQAEDEARKERDQAIDQARKERDQARQRAHEAREQARRRHRAGDHAPDEDGDQDNGRQQDRDTGER